MTVEWLGTPMKQHQNIPTSLSAVSYLFLLVGIVATGEILVGLLRGSFRFNLAVLGFWMFFGLRRYSPGWRTCALVFIWIGIVVQSLILFSALFFPKHIMLFGRSYDGASHIWLLIPVALFFAIELWMYRVLTRTDIRRMFYEQSRTPAA